MITLPNLRLFSIQFQNTLDVWGQNSSKVGVVNSTPCLAQEVGKFHY